MPRPIIPMDRTKWPSVVGLTLSTIHLSLTLPTTPALSKPVHTTFAFLATAGLTLLALSKFLPRDVAHSRRRRSSGSNGGGGGGRQEEHEALHLREVGRVHPSLQPLSSREDGAYPATLRKLRIVVLALLVSILLRLGVWRERLAHAQCEGGMPLEPLIPVVLGGWEVWGGSWRRRKQRRVGKEDKMRSEGEGEGARQNQTYLRVFAAGLVGVGGLVALETTDSVGSSYICALSEGYAWYFPIARYLGFFFDVVIISCITYLVQQQQGRSYRSVALRFASVGWSFLVSSAILLAIGLICLLFSPDDRIWLFSASGLYFQSAFWCIISSVVVSVCALFMIHHAGLMTTAFLATFTAITTVTTSKAWVNLHPFPPTNLDLTYFGICLVMLGFIMYFHTDGVLKISTTEQREIVSTRLPRLFYLALLPVFGTWITLWALHKDVVNFHPIDMLVYEAYKHHEVYLEQSNLSETLFEAVTTYKERYQRFPPPGYDIWYKFATDERSVVIDDYDNIHNDLLPYYTLSPAEIRQRTADIISNPWNDITGIRIRDGKPSIISEAMLAQRWLSDGLVELIGKFSHNLPDMDLAFNLAPEPRIAVPFEDMKHIRDSSNGVDLSVKPDNTHSGDRAKQWTSSAEGEMADTPFIETTREKSFFQLSTTICPPGSAARTQWNWDKSRLCISCSHPQSLGVALENLTTAADICHQPDLESLHELFTTTGLKITHQLYPVFSHSKIRGFNDILYPSIWDYLEKSRYAPDPDFPDPEFDHKKDSLFWRGKITSEDVSEESHWEGMMRQRFINLANGNEKTNMDQPVLLPDPLTSQSGKSRYVPLPVSKLSQLLQTDIHYTNFTTPHTSISSSSGSSLNNQTQESLLGPPSPPPDPQSRWENKYLLHLDDGLSPSPDFLPALRSRSLPFKAGLLQEWYSDRLTPWLHFVPLDVRGQGLWAALAWFAGLDGEVLPGGERVKIDSHARDAERIADKGRVWAGRVLRRVDMEVYFFRLLLEWARITDDRREGLGFDLEKEEEKGGDGK